MANGNGNGTTSGKLLWWVISTLTGIALGVGGSVVGHHNMVLLQHAERLSALETQMKQDSARLNRMEAKIDRILERVRP
jgi:hypothetical protein